MRLKYFFQKLLPRSKGVDACEPDRFAQMLMDVIRRSGELRQLIYDKEGFRIVPAGNNGVALNLHNAHAEFLNASMEDRPAVIERWAQAWSAVNSAHTPIDFAAARPNLLPLLRNSCFLDLLSLQAKIDGTVAADLPCERLNDHLIVMLAHQAAGVAQLVTRQLIDGWNVSFDDCLETAKQNLASRGGGFVSTAPGLFVCDANDSYDAARLVCPSTFDSLNVEGDLVVMAPQRDMLLAAGSDDFSGLLAMAELARHGIASGRPITGVAFRRGRNGWAPWRPDGDDYLEAAFDALALTSRAISYAEQGELLERLYRGEGVTVPQLDVEEDDLAPPRSSCIWRAGAPVLLPIVDEVAIELGGSTARTYFDWDIVCQVVGDRMKPLGMNPERFRVDCFPAAHEIDAMNHLAGSR